MALLLRTPDERESLPDRLGDIGRTRKRVALASGAFAFVATVAGIVTLAVALDAALHLSSLVRALFLTALLAGGGVVWVRGVGRALYYRTDALSVALELENQHPTLNDALASAVSFLGTREEAADEDLRPPKPTGVSNRLTANAVRVAERRAGRLPLDQLVPTGRCWRNAWLCLAALAVALPLAAFNTARAGIAFSRLADPFGSHPWPTKTRIEILAPNQFPARVPKGEAFELKFAVRGLLSGPATVSVRAKDGGEFEEQFPLALNNDAQVPGAAVVTARFDPARVANTFEVRVSSNDAATDWQTVNVVPPPRLVPLDGRPSPQFHYTPPAYTKVSPVQLDGVARIAIPTGSVVQFRAATDVRVSSAVLSFSGDKAGVANAVPLAQLGQLDPIAAVAAQTLADELTADIPLAISSDGTRISATFVPLLSGTYALKLTDDTGLTGTRTLTIDLTADPVPKVTLKRPLAGRDAQYLTPTASVAVGVSADDALYGVRSTFLEYRVGRDGHWRSLPLGGAGAVPVAALAGVVGGTAFAVAPPAGSIEAAARVPVALFTRDDGTPVREGDLIVLRAAADDYDDVAVLKGPGRSANEVEIRIASPEAIDAWLQKELATFRPELKRILDQQSDAREKTSGVKPLPGGALSPTDRERIVSAEQIQQQIAAKVNDLAQGLRAKADLLRETVRANALPKSNTTDRVEIVATELGRTADRDLGTAKQNLADALRLAGLPKPGQERELSDYLRKAGRSQKNVEDTANALLDLLALWGGAGEIRGEARVQKDNIVRQLAANEPLKDRKLNPTEDEQRDLDRAAVRAEQSAEQAGLLIARAARLAAEKDKQADELRGQAAVKLNEAAEAKAKADALTNPVEKSAATAQADAVAAAAADLTAGAEKAEAEAKALRKGIDAAGGQELPDELRKAGELLRKNRQADAAAALNSGAARLGALADALAEKDADAVPELAKPKALKRAADQADALAASQDSLRKRVEAASRLPDPIQRRHAQGARPGAGQTHRARPRVASEADRRQVGRRGPRCARGTRQDGTGARRSGKGSAQHPRSARPWRSSTKPATSSTPPPRRAAANSPTKSAASSRIR